MNFNDRVYKPQPQPVRYVPVPAPYPVPRPYPVPGPVVGLFPRPPRFVDPQYMEVVAILDASGSMRPLAADTVRGFNAYLAQLRASPLRINLTLILFNTGATTVYQARRVQHCPDLTAWTYRADGGTALTDTLADAIHQTAARLAGQGTQPGNVSFFVTTDGEENSSRRFGKADVRALVTRFTDEGWDFFFAGANVDSFAAGAAYGICAANCANIFADGRSHNVVYNAFCNVQMAPRAKRSSLQCEFDALYK